jgi:hypothetical protein
VVGVDRHPNRRRGHPRQRLEECPRAAFGRTSVDHDHTVGSSDEGGVVDPPRAVGLNIGEHPSVDFFESWRPDTDPAVILAGVIIT